MQDLSLSTYLSEKYHELYALFCACADRKAVLQLKRQYRKLLDTDQPTPVPACDGALEHFSKIRLSEMREVPVRSPAEARIDRILYITDSSGKRRARKFS